MDFNEYRNAYASLGEEKVQQIVLDRFDAAEEGGFFSSREDRFFATRQDIAWSILPGKVK
jgi:hypothetical protein